MQKILAGLLCLVMSAMMFGCGESVSSESSGADSSSGGVQTATKYYTNPIFNHDFPDPTIIRGEDGYFYAYATSGWDTYNEVDSFPAILPIIKSADLVEWEYAGSVFQSLNDCAWANGRGIWAPDIVKIGNTYNLYYSAALWGDTDQSSIGVAIAPSPTGPWTDRGEVATYRTTGVKQSIDSFTFVYEGGVYMMWGSYYGIFWVELTADGLAIKEGATPTQIGGLGDYCACEASYLVQHGDYWYLMVSYGNCCEGLTSNYYVQCYRASSPFGPFYGDDGKAFLGSDHGLGTNVIRNGSDFVGCGHNSVIKDDNGDDWLIYHAYDLGGKGDKRILCMDKISWKGGWPHVEGHVASSKAEAPYIAAR